MLLLKWLIFISSISTSLLAMQPLLDDDYLKVKVDHHKFAISSQLVRERGGLLLQELLNNSKRSKRIRLSCKLEEFELAYHFMSKNSMPDGYFVKDALSAATFFFLPEMGTYVEKHPPAWSGVYYFDGTECAHCGRHYNCPNNIVRSKELLARHLEDYHRAKISTCLRHGSGASTIGYRLPTSD